MNKDILISGMLVNTTVDMDGYDYLTADYLERYQGTEGKQEVELNKASFDAPDKTEDISVTYNGTPLVSGVGYTYNALTGEFATVPGVVNVPAASYVQDPVTGAYSVAPGQATITVTGNIAG